MKYAILNVNPPHLNNKIFDKDDALMNRDDCMYHYWLLKEELKKHDIDLVTQDLCKPEDAEFILYDDLPKIPQAVNNPNKYLIIWESELIRPWTWWSKAIYKDFKKIFSWYPFDDARFVKMYWPQKMDVTPYSGPKSKFLCIIAGNKQSTYYKELYSERQKAIDYFGDRIDVYGHGYNPIPNKYDVMKDYKFAICFENARDIKGYVTEKIFDCFKAGTIPIYWGNDDGKLGEFSTMQSYIDFGEYRDNTDKNKWQQLDNDISNMSENKRIEMQFIGNRAITQLSAYSAKNWVMTIIRNIVK